MIDNILLFIALASRCVAALMCWYFIGVGAVVSYKAAKRYALRRFANVLSW